MLSLVKSLIGYRELISELTLREIKQRYKQSILGYAWVMLNPLFQMLVMAFVFSKLLHVADLAVPYPVFLYVGLLPWNLFSSSVTASAGSLVNNSGLLTKIYFPREIFVISTIFSKLVDFALALVVLAGFLVYFQISVSLNILWIFPILAIQVLFTFGLALMVSAFNLFYRDIQYIINLIIMVAFYVTPIIYPNSMMPQKYQFIFYLNPMAVFINSYRDTVLFGEPPDFFKLGTALGISFFTVLVGYAIFKKLEGSFADIV